MSISFPVPLHTLSLALAAAGAAVVVGDPVAAAAEGKRRL